MKNFALIAAIALPLAACNSNTAPGNDREAQISLHWARKIPVSFV